MKINPPITVEAQEDGIVFNGLRLGWHVVTKQVAPGFARMSDSGNLYPYTITDILPNDELSVLVKLGWWTNRLHDTHQSPHQTGPQSPPDAR